MKKTCFVIMPFGKKKLIRNKKINFDSVYRDLIKTPMENELDLHVVRSDEVGMAGWIHREMINHIFHADVCIADLTTENPNVFYELGVRHALRRGVTVLIKHTGFDLPFNVQGMRTIEYTAGEYDEVRPRIVEFVRKGLDSAPTDSLVFEVIKNLEVSAGRETPISPSRRVRYPIKKYPSRHIGLIGGDLNGITDIPVWVNSENTNMQMARSYDRSISGVVRYLGAKKTFGHIEADLIADDLKAQLDKVVGHKTVMAGTVLETTPGELATRGVKLLLHVAAVQGTAAGRGYKPVDNLDECINNVLSEVDRKIGAGPVSVLLPLLGTGTAAGKPEELVPVLLDSALTYMNGRGACAIETLWFLAYSEQIWSICSRLLAERSERCGPAETIP